MTSTFETTSRPRRGNGITTPTRRGGSGRVLTDVIVDLGFVDRGTMDLAIERGTGSGSAPERVLVSDGTLSDDQLSRAVAERFGLDHIDLSVYRVDPDAAKLVTPAAVRRYQAVPVSFTGDRTLVVAMVDPANVLAIDDIAVMTGYEVRPAVASLADVERLLTRLEDPNFGHGAIAPDETEEEPAAPTPAAPAAPLYDVRENQPIQFGVGGEDASVIQLVHRVIQEAVERGASDIHFEPQEEEMRVRYRIDGVLQEAATVPASAIPAVVSRIKILSDLDIAERRIPQDGRISLEVGDKPIDLRVATLPAQYGEKAVMRILDQSKVMIQLEQLGMLPQALERFTKAFSQAHGAVLVTGPTGSGKSTSLYGALNQLNTIEKHIITIEDPVEYQLPGITQVQVNNKAGLTFASGLRSMMRADPDIIMVGEIRDKETAQIAIEAALTGHLVLSTLHTNDAPGAVTRLIEMGVEPFLVGSAVDCVVAQRLARLLCEECKRRTTITSEVMRANGFNVGLDLEAYEPVGCARCGGSGYKGRIGLYEVMWVSDTIRSLAVAREPSETIAHAAVHEGMMRLREDGLEKVRRGLTSIAEIARVAGTR
ncbi:Flp pilus assembly complex ATPase component TadA [Solirubrobacter sp. CPCC 204708]|uniref:ATPase, T2SS/T4P/T4SS family n=1 Tax=Solirubrobacter deserti TaxID=2282478 RepID=A0ABT4RHT9_9ACTN|nr:ATPase, T2SS/T4P/T4SS family [Solirubrobacter deserti]MBE2316585.1 Flp pilus assembly complex ATPase component TadA [Solirubrobacter deserti]MDA0138117.1 ATPase, T2SS/T4P/T4SS family [Solirubrobacter deserti]